MLTVLSPAALVDDLKFFADRRGLSRDEAIIRALRGFVASSIVHNRREADMIQ